MLDFERSADVLLILIIGGTGYLYGGLIGAVLFKLMQDYLANVTPQYWQFWLGLVLVVIVLRRPRRSSSRRWTAAACGIVHGRHAGRRAPPHRRSHRAPAVQQAAATRMATMLRAETIGLAKRFGGIIATNNVSLSVEKGARHALIGPNGAGKTTIINLLTGVLRPTAGRILLEGSDITDLEPHKRVRLGIARTFQINQLFADLTPLETIGLAVSERMELGRQWWRLAGSKGAS